MNLLLSCLLAISGFVAGHYLCRVSESYVRLYRRGLTPTTALLRLALARALRKGERRRSHTQVALLTGALLALAGVVFRDGFTLLAFTVALLMLVLLALIDWRISLLPDALTQPLLWLGLGLAWSGGGLITPERALGSAMVSYLALRAFSACYRLLRQREGLGRGDVKLIAAISAWLGWQDALWVVLAGSLFGLLLALRHLRALPSLATPQPFGPPLILATLVIAALRVAEQA